MLYLCLIFRKFYNIPYLSSLYLTKKDENDEFKTKTYNFMGNELQKEEPSYKEFYTRKKYKEKTKENSKDNFDFEIK